MLYPSGRIDETSSLISDGENNGGSAASSVKPVAAPRAAAAADTADTIAPGTLVVDVGPGTGRIPFVLGFAPDSPFTVAIVLAGRDSVNDTCVLASFEIGSVGSAGNVESTAASVGV